MTRGCFISDLHLFSPRSNYHFHEDHCLAMYQASDLIILGGDIFDFRWTKLSSHQHTIDCASKWLENLQQNCPTSKIVFLMGNHDSHPDLIVVLDNLARQMPNFLWRSDFLRIGDSLFLHGDVLNAGMKSGGLIKYRRKFHHEKPKSRAAHGAYDAVVAMRLHSIIPRLKHRPQVTCLRLVQMIEHHASNRSSPLRRIFFGHTHVSIKALRLGGIEFHNPGAALKHVHFAPIAFEMSEALEF